MKIKIIFTTIGFVLYGFCALTFASDNNVNDNNANIVAKAPTPTPTLQNNVASEEVIVAKPVVEKVKHGFAMTICRGVNMIHTTRKIVALTFDDGPHKKYTKEILDILKLNDVKATFFFVGKNAEFYPGVVKLAYRNGNIIGNHTYSHYYLTSLSDEAIEQELIRTSQIIYNIISVQPVFFRPPYGACSARSSKVLQRMGFISIGWSDMVNDYDVTQMTPEKIVEGILKYARPGVIIGMHDGGGNRENTVKALPVIISALKAKGYEFLTMSELLGIAAYRQQ